MTSRFVLSGFGDEISADPDEQLAVLASLGVGHLDLRGAWERNILDFAPDDVANMKAALARHGSRASMIASPIGKSDISQDPAFELERLGRAIGLASEFHTPLIRMFSFYHPSLPHADCRDEVIDRLSAWAVVAASAGVTLLLENEADLWGDTPERAHELLSAVESPHLRLTLDAGNFASLGIDSATHAYPLLRPFLVHVQIKDVRRGVGTTIAGHGDGQIAELIRLLVEDDYRGYLSLEPHLAHAGKAGGFSGPELFGEAVRALRAIVGGIEH